MSLRPNSAATGNSKLSVEDCEVLHAKAGDGSAFAPLMRRHYAEVLRVATRHAPTAHLGEDVASETFTFAWQNIGRFAIGSDFGAWVKSVAWQLARAGREREACRQRGLERYAEHCRVEAEPEAFEKTRNRAAAVFDLLAVLPAERRELVMLCCVEGRTSEEAASFLGRTSAWVRITLHRTRVELRAAAARLSV